MSDYISREEAKAAIRKKFPGLRERCEINEVLNSIPAADVRPVVLCKDCEWWEKQKDSAQGRCALMGMYPTGGWFCANGKKEETHDNQR